MDVKSCVDPPPDENGTWTIKDKVATLTCNEGYAIPDGEGSTMTCVRSSSAMWNFDGGLPQCRSTSLVDELLPDDNMITPLDSRCRGSTNLVSFYMTELNGINVIIKLLIIWFYFKKYKKRKPIITGLIILLSIHTCVHILIIIASLPQLCDSSNFNWKEGPYFNKVHCHWKSKLYYSLPFWFIDIIVPGVIAIYLLRK